MYLLMKKLLKPLTIILLTAALVLGITLAAISLLDGKLKLAQGRKPDVIVAVDSSVSDEELTNYVKLIIKAIKERDYAAIASVVHPDYGVIFSPYATINLTTDRCFTKAQVAAFNSDVKEYIWGIYDGSGEPIEMTPASYFNEFVFDTDFTKCSNYGVDEILRSGNSLENVEEVFTDARYVDCYMPDPKGEGEPNWRSLRLVFEDYKGELLLTAVIHSENTI